MTAARAAGLIAKEAAQVIDSSHVLGAAGVRDTYTRIRGGSRKLLRALGDAASTRGRLPDCLAWYLDPARPDKPALDWDDAPARAAHLGDLVADAPTARALVGPAPAARPAVAEAAALLTKIVADDVTTAPPAATTPGPTRPGRPRRQPPTDPAPASAAPASPPAAAPGSGPRPDRERGRPRTAGRAHERAPAVGRLQGPGDRGADQRVAAGGRGPSRQRARRGGGR